MWKDKIVEQVRQTRERIFSEFDYDMKKYSAYIIVQQKKSGRKYVTLEDMKKAKETR